jgi:hypothetical protein
VQRYTTTESPGTFGFETLLALLLLLHHLLFDLTYVQRLYVVCIVGVSVLWNMSEVQPQLEGLKADWDTCRTHDDQKHTLIQVQ